MTDIVTGTVVHFIANANPNGPPVYDPDTSGVGFTVNLPDGTDDCTAELAIFARYIRSIKDNTAAGVPVDKDRRDRLEDATKGWVQVIDLRRTPIPLIK
jgi:hypothetical protein